MNKKGVKSMKKTMGKGIGAWLLAFAILCSLVMVPATKVQAAEVNLNPTTGSQTATVSSGTSVDVLFTVPGDYNTLQKLKNAGLTSLEVTFKVTSISASSSETPGAQVFMNVTRESDNWISKWQDITSTQLNQNLTVTVDFSSMLSDATTAFQLGLQFTKVTGSVQYEIISAKLLGSGSSSSSGGGGNAGGGNIGTIDTSQDYNFAKLLQYSLYFYDANMCGDRVSETSLYSQDLYGGWRGDCHVNDKFTYGGKTYSAVGGYHDAGDHVKFGLPMAQAMTTLGIGYHEFGQAFDELGQKEHLKTIVDYYCTYVKSCTVFNNTGNVEAFCYQVGHGQKDHESWVAPEIENETATERYFTLIADSSNPATDIVGGTAAALAMNYLNFGNEEDLKYAKALFAFAKGNSKANGAYDTDSGGNAFYHSNYGSWEDEYCLAAALLYQITKDEGYKTEYNTYNQNNGNIQKPYGWENVYQAAAFYAPEKSSSELTTINNWFSGIMNANQSQYYCGDSWGSARVNCNVQLMMLVYDKQNNVNTYANWCKYQMSTILGNNTTRKNLVCGYNTNSPVKPHHRAASGYSGWNDFNNNATQKYTLFGALVGGPTSSDFSTYNDKVNDAVSNEVTLDYNAGLVGATAALYLLNKNSTEAGFTNQTIRADFYGGSDFENKIESGGAGNNSGGAGGGSNNGGGQGGAGGSNGTGDESITKATGLALTANVKKASGVPVTGTYKLAAKKSMQLVVTFLPENAPAESLTYTSSNSKIATVDGSGKVKAGKKSGKTVITVTSASGLTASATVQVMKKAVSKVTIKGAKKSLKVGKTMKLKATTSPSKKKAGNNVVWISGNPKVATVSSTGKVTAVGKGKTKITAVAADGSGKKATITVKVK